MADDISYEIQVRKNGNWVRLAQVATPQQAELDGRAALEERRYLEAYLIVCERRDSRSGKVNRTPFAPVLRENLHDAADQLWERHIQGKPAVDPPAKKKAGRSQFSWILPVLALLVIMWGAYFTLVYVQGVIFAK
jgi:hypothetical protein